MALMASAVFAAVGYCVDANEELQHALARMAAPQLQGNEALSATFVSTRFSAQPLEASESGEAEVIKTTVSEMVVNNTCVREHVGEARKNVRSNDTLDLFKRYGYHYADDGTSLALYHSSLKRGRIQRTDIRHDKLEAVLSPNAAITPLRYVSRAEAMGFEKYAEAVRINVTRENSHVVYEGEFVDRDPERYFRVVVAANNDVVRMVELDRDRRPLLDIERSDFISLEATSSHFRIAGHTTVAKFNYDDNDGNSRTVSNMDILAPEVLELSKEEFKLAFPSDAIHIYNADMGVEISGATADSRLMSAISEMDLSVSSGRDIIARAETQYSSSGSKPMSASSGIQLPRASANAWLIAGGQVAVVGSLLLALLYFIVRNIYRELSERRGLHREKGGAEES